MALSCEAGSRTHYSIRAVAAVAAPALKTPSFVCVQVDTPTKKILLGIAVAYIGLVVILPFVNVFIQVNRLSAAELGAIVPTICASHCNDAAAAAMQLLMSVSTTAGEQAGHHLGRPAWSCVLQQWFTRRPFLPI
jgi:hypothetical protein